MTINGMRFALVAAFAVTIAAQVWWIPSQLDRTVSVFPETAPLQTLGVTWSVALLVCVQLALLIAWKLLGIVGSGGRVSEQGRGWIRALIATAAVFSLLSASAGLALLSLNWATPGVMLALGCCGVTGFVGAALGGAYIANFERQWQRN